MREWEAVKKMRLEFSFLINERNRLHCLFLFFCSLALILIWFCLTLTLTSCLSSLFCVFPLHENTHKYTYTVLMYMKHIYLNLWFLVQWQHRYSSKHRLKLLLVPVFVSFFRGSECPIYPMDLVGNEHPINHEVPKKVFQAVVDRSLWPTRWVKAVYNVCGLACIIGLTSPNSQVSLTTK